MRTVPLRGLWNRLRSTYWFVPALITLGSIALAAGLVALDTSYPGLASSLGWIYSGGASGAQALLSAVAGSMVTVVSVTFSVTVVALTVSSQHFGPRLLNSFMRDAAAQLVLGTFIGTFAFCVVVLRTVHGGGDGYSIFVPHLAVTTGVALTLVSVGMLIYYVHHVSASLQVSEIASGVGRDLERAIDRIYPDPIGEPGAPERAERVPDGAGRIAAPSSGYVQEIDAETLLEQARQHDVVVWVVARPGDFVAEGVPLAAVHPPAADRDALAEALQGAFLIGNDRTSRQDAGFAVQQLVEVALHALSPGINEPFTAITCIDRLSQGLARLLDRSLPSARRLDDDGRLRVIACPHSFADLLHEAFAPIRVYAGPNPAIGERMLAAMAMLALRARRDDDRAALRSAVEETFEAASRHTEAPRDRTRLAAAHQRAMAALDAAAAP